VVGAARQPPVVEGEAVGGDEDDASGDVIVVLTGGCPMISGGQGRGAGVRGEWRGETARTAGRRWW
jgi:hypothetical protein